ncbi:hypothetical protein ACIBAC_15030 [Streptomyces sp. NPDC051362]|uniref:hypothetical protein n=1 Tax=Streptomyces sp. NPDC051362 TaxID=3365651 RepID=UPI0037A01091
MITPQLTVDGTAVQVPIRGRAVALVDELALAYAENPDDFGRLLAAHAASVLRLDFAECSETAPEHVIAMRAAEADGTREALLDELPSAERLDEVLDPESAISLATRLTKLAAAVRRRYPDASPTLAGRFTQLAATIRTNKTRSARP